MGCDYFQYSPGKFHKHQRPGHIDFRPLLRLRQVLRAHFSRTGPVKACVAADLGKQRAAAGIVQVRAGRAVSPQDADAVTNRILAEPIPAAIVVVALFVSANWPILREGGAGSSWLKGGDSANYSNTLASVEGIA